MFRFLILSVLAAHIARPASADDGDNHAARHRKSVEVAQARIDRAGDRATASEWVQLADAQLRGGRVDEAVKHFEIALNQQPALRPHLWQYGIALYFADRYANARDLFVEHRKVNPNDVENAAWHFLCAAKASDVDQARAILLPAPGDPRPPMNAILRRLTGGDSAEIDAVVKRQVGAIRRLNARFYGDLYLGLIADAEGGRVEQARTYLNAAAAAPLRHYMADVARVYAARLEDPKE